MPTGAATSYVSAHTAICATTCANCTFNAKLDSSVCTERKNNGHNEQGDDIRQKQQGQTNFEEVRELVAHAYQRAMDILNEYRDKLDAVAEKLLEIETISRAEFEEIFPTPVTKNSGTPVMQGA